MRPVSCLVFFVSVFCLTNILDGLLQREYPVYTFRRIMQAFTGRSGTARGLKKAEKFQRIQTKVQYEAPFPCDVSSSRSASPPTSVHQLRPGDISVMGALGDSLTAANGNAATNLLDVATENRGLSWAIGGQGTWKEHLTLGNILKEFNPQLVGYSYNDSFSHQRPAQFNLAEPGSMSQDMPYMAKVLVKRIRLDPRVDMENHWKLVTIMIGGNDYCTRICYDYRTKDLWKSQEDHRRNLHATLDYLKANLPKTLVNLVASPQVAYLLRNMIHKPPECRITHMFECPCLFGLAREYPPYLKSMNEAIEAWRKVEEEVIVEKVKEFLFRVLQKLDNGWTDSAHFGFGLLGVSSDTIDKALEPRYNDESDFTVVLQPFLMNLDVPLKNGKTDFSLFSTDCFHLSQKGAARAANSLWNNMLEPVGEKTRDWTVPFSRFLCPTDEQPFIFTNYNSIPQDYDVRQS